MGTRKPHSKSRLGCAQCKKRRVKCDGKAPICASCEKRAFDYSFRQLLPTQRLTSTSTTPVTESNVMSIRNKRPYEIFVFRNGRGDGPLTSSPTSSNVDNTSLVPEINTAPYHPPGLKLCNSVLQNVPSDLLYLLGHYHNNTSLTLANDDPAKHAWQAIVPELATHHPYLMHGILSITSLQLGYLHSDRARASSMNSIAVDQMNQVLAYYRPAIESVTKENAPSLFATATLTTVFAFRTATVDIQEALATLSPGHTTAPQATINQLVEFVARTAWSVRSALGVLSPGWQWVTKSELSALCTREWWPKHRVPANLKAMEEDARLSLLQNMWTASNGDCSDEAQCLAEALHELRQTYALVSQLTISVDLIAGTSDSKEASTVNILRDRAAIIAWAARVPREFVNLLERGNREAMIIMAHWAVLLARVRNVWWSDGLGTNMVAAISSIVGEKNRDLLQWPAQLVGVALPG